MSSTVYLRTGPGNDVAPVGDGVGEHEREIVGAVAHHAAGIDIVPAIVLDEEIAVAVRADGADHRGRAAELTEGGQRRGHLSAALPAGLQHPRTLVLLRGQVVDVHQVVDKRRAVGNQISFHGIMCHKTYFPY